MRKNASPIPPPCVRLVRRSDCTHHTTPGATANAMTDAPKSTSPMMKSVRSRPSAMRRDL